MENLKEATWHSNWTFWILIKIFQACYCQKYVLNLINNLIKTYFYFLKGFLVNNETKLKRIQGAAFGNLMFTPLLQYYCSKRLNIRMPHPVIFKKSQISVDSNKPVTLANIHNKTLHSIFSQVRIGIGIWFVMFCWWFTTRE